MVGMITMVDFLINSHHSSNHRNSSSKVEADMALAIITIPSNPLYQVRELRKPLNLAPGEILA
jgi:hypothetical protein